MFLLPDTACHSDSVWKRFFGHYTYIGFNWFSEFVYAVAAYTHIICTTRKINMALGFIYAEISELTVNKSGNSSLPSSGHI